MSLSSSLCLHCNGSDRQFTSLQRTTIPYYAKCTPSSRLECQGGEEIWRSGAYDTDVMLPQKEAERHVGQFCLDREGKGRKKGRVALKCLRPNAALSCVGRLAVHRWREFLNCVWVVFYL